MTLTIEDIEKLITDDEDEHLEFKAASNQFDTDLLFDYCIALANECGGRLILGVTNNKPRKIVGSEAFRSLKKVKSQIYNHLGLRVEVDEINHPHGRVVEFRIPSRPIGTPLNYKGKYLMRVGESVVPMSLEQIKRILDENVPDFSATICPSATINDLSFEAVKVFRQMWAQKTGKKEYLNHSERHILEESELIKGSSISYAALILFGTHGSLGKYLAQSEIVFEYRNEVGQIDADQRKDFREGFFLTLNELWELINLRNTQFQYQDGLFRASILTFDEEVIREALLNAVSHRCYQQSGSIFVKQYPSKIEIISPGGFPEGITPENLLDGQNPRNRRIAEIFQKCGLVERSGQGIDRMFEKSLKQGKHLPDYSYSTDYYVKLILDGQVQDVRFLKFIEKVVGETSFHFSIKDLLLLNLINSEKQVKGDLKDQIPELIEHGIIERISHGKGTRYILSKRFYDYLKTPGTHTRIRGLDKDQNKALLEKHIKKNPGCQLAELQQVLTLKTNRQVRGLLYELQLDGKISCLGRTSAAKWFPSKEQNDLSKD